MINNYDSRTMAINYVTQYAILFSFLTLFSCIIVIILYYIGRLLSSKSKERLNSIFEIIPYSALYENDSANLTTEIKRFNNGDESFMINKNQLKKIIVETPKNDRSDFESYDMKENSNILTDLAGIVIPEPELETTKINNSNLVQLGTGQNQKKIYLCYVFDNMNNDDSESQVFDDLVVFINIVLKTMNHKMVEIIFIINSPGGSADAFQNAYSQIKRLRDNNFVLTALVDCMCASGGYMCAAACNKIICSEYAEIGSIGVVATFHNYHTLSQKIGIIEKTITTGLYKRPFLPGEPLEQDQINRVGESVNESLNIFKNIVQKSRNISEEQMTQILSAKTWNGVKAMELGLVDQIMFSNDYLDKLDQVFCVTRIETDKESKIKELLSMVSKKIFKKILSIVVKSIIGKKKKRNQNQMILDM